MNNKQLAKSQLNSTETDTNVIVIKVVKLPVHQQLKASRNSPVA